MGFCALAEVASRRLSLSPELVRKLAHMSSGVFAALLPLVLSFGQIAGLGLGFALLMAVSLRLGIFTGIHGVSRATYGELYFPLGLAALAVISSRPVPFAYGALVLGLGDGLAALAGERLGRRTVPIIATKKTLWGSGTFLTTCFAVGAALTASTGLPLTHAAAVAATTAVALTPVELLLTRGLDNLALPILAGLLLASL
jgi:phytol kinase